VIHAGFAPRCGLRRRGVPRSAALAAGLSFAIAAMLAISAVPEASAADVAATSAPVDPAAEAIRHGRRLYRVGALREFGELSARVSGQVEISGPLASCARCHGTDGAGGREAGLVAPPLRWDALTTARPAADGLPARPAYDERTLLDAVRRGHDPLGRPLSVAMPRFALGPREAADLVAYLRVVGTPADRAPGVSDTQVTFATALPLTGPLAERGAAVREAMTACLERASREGGVYGRRVALEAIDSTAPGAAAALAAVRGRSLALLVPWWPEGGPVRTAGDDPWPVIAPLWPQPWAGPRGEVFEVAALLPDQARVLIDVIADRFSGRKATVAVRLPPGARGREAGEAARDQASRHPGLVLREGATVAAGVDAILVLGDASELAGLPPAVPVYAVAAELGRAAFGLPAELRARLVLAHAGPMPDDLDPRRMRADFALIGASVREPALQAHAWTGACLGVEALRRAGRAVDGSALRRGLESISRFESKVVPPLAFGPNQHNGLWGARLVAVEADRYRELAPWRTPRDEP
jgi:mono/diheme cytochrome c family protein